MEAINELLVVETNLTAEEKAIIAKSRKEVKAEECIPLDDFLKSINYDRH